MSMTIRAMTGAELLRIVSMEREIFPDPWPLSSFEDLLASEDWSALVAEHEGTIIGYACFLIIASEAHLANIAVDKEHRRKSVAKRLLDRILVIITARQCTMLLLEVRPSNAGAIAFYTGNGFAHLYRRPNYYRRPVEDALVMVRHLDT